MLREKRLPHDVACDCCQLFILLLNRGDLDFFFTGDRFFRHCGIEQDVREQVHAEFQVGLHHIERHAKAVIP